MKIVTVVGARPQFIKASAVTHTIRTTSQGKIDEVLVHTGQHFDTNMSAVFFEELDIPEPRYNLGVSGGSHASMTARMMLGLEEILRGERPDRVLVYGDTNSTLAAALTAAQLRIPVAHVEAGVRSFRLDMPEEVNRLVTDRVSSLLFCPSKVAVSNLEREGISNGVCNSGDVTCDLLKRFSGIARADSRILERLGLEEKRFALVTCHRAENTDDPVRFRCILDTVGRIASQLPVVLPLHPRTRKTAQALDILQPSTGLRLVEPLPFLDMLRLEQCASVILTDSGGVQKEAFFLNVPCITLREETEWTETVELGANVLTGVSPDRILAAFSEAMSIPRRSIEARPYGDGNASETIVSLLAG